MKIKNYDIRYTVTRMAIGASHDGSVAHYFIKECSADLAKQRFLRHMKCDVIIIGISEEKKTNTSRITEKIKFKNTEWSFENRREQIT